MINKIYITFLLFITTVTATMAAAGIFRTEININNVNYVMYDNNTVQGTNGSTISGSPFANAASIILNGGFNKTFKDGGAGNICSGVLAYRVYLVGSTPPAFTDINLPFVSNDGGNNNQTWGTTGANISLPNSIGDYRIDFFYRATGSNSNSSACNETFFQSNSSNNFTLLYSVQAPLPVIFSSFNVAPEGQTVKIDWATAQEINNAYFEVDRSKDLQTWENVAQKEGAGNSKTGKSYTITDFSPQKGTNYYRLTQVDADGTRSMFPRLRSAVLEVNPDIVLYPNPSDEVVRLSGINEDANVTIMDMTGALKIEKKVTRNDNTVKISTLAAGTYVLRVQDETATKIMKIVVNK
jgi:hypothetical protein